jgi:hypothetical protein
MRVALMSYGPHFANGYREGARYVGRVPQRREARRFTGHAANKIRVGDQPEDRWSLLA